MGESIRRCTFQVNKKYTTVNHGKPPVESSSNISVGGELWTKKRPLGAALLNHEVMALGSALREYRRRGEYTRQHLHGINRGEFIGIDRRIVCVDTVLPWCSV